MTAFLGIGIGWDGTSRRHCLCCFCAAHVSVPSPDLNLPATLPSAQIRGSASTLDSCRALPVYRVPVAEPFPYTGHSFFCPFFDEFLPCLQAGTAGFWTATCSSFIVLDFTIIGVMFLHRMVNTRSGMGYFALHRELRNTLRHSGDTCR